MDVKDRLELLKKQRAVRSRSSSPAGKVRPDRVQETWNKIDREETLTVKEKLQKLISLTGSKPGRDTSATRSRGEDVLAAEVEPFQVFDNSYDLQVRYGRTLLAHGLEVRGEVLNLLGRTDDFDGLDLSTALFIDLETTGLAGGTGTVPFLVGMGFYRDGRFQVVQYFLHDLGGEEAMIRDLGRFIKEAGFRSVVTYNGRAFDIPILETRFILQREPFRLSSLPHLDFLFPARVLWKHKHENCRLFHLAHEVVQTDRAEDIPSAEIPVRYFSYLRNRDFSLIEPILYHNQEDILSLLALVVSGAGLVTRSSEEETGGDLDGMDYYGVGRMFDRAGQSGMSVQAFRRAVGSRLSSGVALQARLRLSQNLKKQGHFEQAASVWMEIASQNQLSSSSELAVFRELSIHFERRVKNIKEAIRFAEEGLALSKASFPGLQQDFGRRLRRLKDKSLRRKGGKTAR